MNDRLNPSARIANSDVHDQIVGGLFRREIVSWADLAKHDLNEIASWGTKFRWWLEEFKAEFEARGLCVLPFDAFALLSETTKKSLVAGGIASLADLQARTGSELTALKGIGSRALHDIDEACRFAGIVLRPEAPNIGTLTETLRVVQSDWVDGTPVKNTAAKLNISPARVTQLRRKLERIERQGLQRVAEHKRWQAQQSEFTKREKCLG